jgi:signal peptidase
MAHRTVRAKRRRRRRALIDALVWLALGLMLAMTASSMFGGPVRLILVRGASMDPTFASGDLIVVEAFTTPDVGDIISYPIQAGDGEAHIVHRATGGDEHGYVTRGDNRETDDPWTPSADEIDGSVVLHLPWAGRLVTGWMLPLISAAAAGFVLTCALWSEPERARPPGRITVTELPEPGAERDAA